MCTVTKAPQASISEGLKAFGRYVVEIIGRKTVFYTPINGLGVYYTPELTPKPFFTHRFPFITHPFPFITHLPAFITHRKASYTQAQARGLYGLDPFHAHQQNRY
jgi:hypothetical protein